MTPHPQQEYAITKKELDDIQDAIGLSADCEISHTICQEAIDRARNRPIPAPAAPDMQRCSVCGNSLEFQNSTYVWCKNMHAFRYFPQQINAATIRNETLNMTCRCDLYDIATGAMKPEDAKRCTGKECNWCGRYNDSLRTSSPQAQDPERGDQQ